MKTINCKMCGARLYAEENQSICTCEYCGSTATIPQINEERILNLFNKANNHRMNSEFDRAMATYESILDEDNRNAEAHWGLVLCRYGVEYVKDTKTGKMIPTCHRTLFSPIFTDSDYKATIDNADLLSKRVYESEAHEIAALQKHIIEVSSKLKPYDVFISYKESDEFGGRTEDSSIAQDICTYLTNEGLNVFYSRISLRALAGSEYEPYIFSALHSAKVMIVVGTKREYLESPWVKNEWGRYLSLMREKKDRVLLPCYREMSVNSLPEEFINCEALDASTPTFMLDLITSIRNVIKKESPARGQAVTVESTMSGNAAALAKRGYIYLEDGEFQEAIDCFNKSLDLSPESSSTYWGLLLANAACRNNNALAERGKPLGDSKEYQKAIRFAAPEELAEYKRVTDRIAEVVQTMRGKLLRKEAQQIAATGVEQLLQLGQQDRKSACENAERILTQLKAVENQQRKCAEDCAKALADVENRIRTNGQQLNSLYAELPQKTKRIDDKSKAALSERTAALQAQIQEAEDTWKRIVNDGTEFEALRKLQVQQAEFDKALINETTKLVSVSRAMTDVQKKIQGIREEFGRALQETERGEYAYARELLAAEVHMPKTVRIEQIAPILQTTQKDDRVRPTVQADGTILCPKCGKKQQSNRSACYSCGVKFNYDLFDTPEEEPDEDGGVLTCSCCGLQFAIGDEELEQGTCICPGCGEELEIYADDDEDDEDDDTE